MNGLNKCVMVRETDIIKNKEVKLLGCEDSYVYIDAPLQSLLIANCVNCVFFIAAVRISTTIEKCEGCQITVASNYLRIGNCVDTQIYSYTGSC